MPTNDANSKSSASGAPLSSVFVAVRVRPVAQEALATKGGACLAQQGRTQLAICSPTDDSSNPEPKQFSYDCVFGPDAKQEDLYEVLGKRILDNALQGYNGCLFAYGQTGSGKTFTVLGQQPYQPGIIPRFCVDLFAQLDQRCRQNQNSSDERLYVQTEVEYFEIYGEKVRDLLDETAAQSEEGYHRDLRVREHPKRGPYIEGLTRVSVNSAQQVQQLMELGSRSRVTAATNMNDVSSRSHAICRLTIHLTKMVPSTDSSKPGSWHVISDTTSVVNLVDLAGSERIKESGAEGVRMKEAVSINSSLTSLGRVISELAKGNHLNSDPASAQQHIPYRNCKLTWLLRDSLGGNSKTCMVATVSPVAQYYHETLSTLRYASMCKKIKNKAVINEDPNARRIRELQAEIRMLRTALHELMAQRGLTSGSTCSSLDVSTAFVEQAQAIEKAVQLNCKMMDQLQGLWEGRNQEEGRMMSLDQLEVRMREMESQPGFTPTDPRYSQLNDRANLLRQQRAQDDRSMSEKERVLAELETEKQAVEEANQEFEALQNAFAQSRMETGQQLDATADELELSRFRACNMKAVSMHRDQVMSKVSKRHEETKRKLELELKELEDELRTTMREREDLLALKSAKEALGAPVTARSRAASHLSSPAKRAGPVMGASPTKSTGALLSYRKHPTNGSAAMRSNSGGPILGGSPTRTMPMTGNMMSSPVTNRSGLLVTSPQREVRTEDALREFFALAGAPAEGTQRHQWEMEMVQRLREVQRDIDQGRDALAQLNLNTNGGLGGQPLNSARSRGKTVMTELESDPGSTNRSNSTTSSHHQQQRYMATGQPYTSGGTGFQDPSRANSVVRFTSPAAQPSLGGPPCTPPRNASSAIRSTSHPCPPSSSSYPTAATVPAPSSSSLSSGLSPHLRLSPASARSVSLPPTASAYRQPSVDGGSRARASSSIPHKSSSTKKKSGFFGFCSSFFSFRPGGKKVHYPDPARVPEMF